MKSWQIALLVVVLVVGAGLVLRSTKTAPKTVQRPSTSNDLFASAFGAALAGLGKLGAPSGAPASSNAPSVPAGFDTNNYAVQNGFEYTDASGNFVAG